MTQLVLDLGYRPALGRADFLVAPCNADAVAWLDRWPDWPAPALVIYGDAGCGKTHLVRAWQARSGAPLLAAVELANDRVPALLGGARAAAVDDADRAPAEPLLHLFNLLAERRGHLLLAAATPPARWEITLADLRSRLVAVPAIPMALPDDALLRALLAKLFSDRQLRVEAEVVGFLVTHLERSFDAARQAVAALDRASLSGQRPVTIPLARQVLALDRRPVPPVTPVG